MKNNFAKIIVGLFILVFVGAMANVLWFGFITAFARRMVYDLVLKKPYKPLINLKKKGNKKTYYKERK